MNDERPDYFAEAPSVEDAVLRILSITIFIDNRRTSVLATILE